MIVFFRADNKKEYNKKPQKYKFHFVFLRFLL